MHCTETWFKVHHDVNTYQLDGYTCYRRDRAKRRGGGVAVYVRSRVGSELYIIPGDDTKFEILWVKTFVNKIECFIGALYHPPKTAYSTSDILSYLEHSLDSIHQATVGHSPLVILAGDFNQITNDDILLLGLQAGLFAPTHRGHNLDRLYTRGIGYKCVKVVASTIKTEHRAIVAQDESSTIIDF